MNQQSISANSYSVQWGGLESFLSKGQSIVQHILPQFVQQVTRLSGFRDESSFNHFATGVIDAWLEAGGSQVGSSASFKDVLGQINPESKKQSIVTDWGGVLIEVPKGGYQPGSTDPHIEKYLAVRSGTFLAFEWHTQKEETLRVREGYGILVYEKEKDAPLEVVFLAPSVEVYLPPTHKHSIIALTDLLVYETSEDHLGMDQDLKFEFMPDSKTAYRMSAA